MKLNILKTSFQIIFNVLWSQLFRDGFAKLLNQVILSLSLQAWRSLKILSRALSLAGSQMHYALYVFYH